MANRRYSANHTVGADMPRPAPGSGSSKGGSYNEKSASWKTDIGPRGPRMNKVGFPEVKAYPVYHLNDDPADPSVFEMGGAVAPTPPILDPSGGMGMTMPDKIGIPTMPMPDKVGLPVMPLRPAQQRRMARREARIARRAARRGY